MILFNNLQMKKEFCCLGSLKANIGHLAEVSGIASVIKGGIIHTK